MPTNRIPRERHPQVRTKNTGAYERLKAMIYNRELKPGERLVQMTLAKKLGTSAMPIIEALRRLESDGLAIHVPQLGSFVRESSVEDICELYCLRRGMESEACLLFAERATPEDIQQLIELDKKINTAAAAGDLKTVLQADMDFHLHIVTATRVNRLIEFFERNQIEQKVFSQSPERHSKRASLVKLVGMHKEIVDALSRRDGPAAAAAMRQHLLTAERDYVAFARALK